MDSQQFESVLTPLTQEREWEFTIESANGEEIECKGSEPDTEDQVAELIHPVDDAQMLFHRSVSYLHDNPQMTDEQWESLTPTNKALIASNHLEHWGVFDLISEEEIEEAKRRIVINELDF